jgi:hypothetical protein
VAGYLLVNIIMALLWKQLRCRRNTCVSPNYVHTANFLQNELHALAPDSSWLGHIHFLGNLDIIAL